MKAKPISILVAALFSASAIAAGNSSQGSSAQEPQQPQAQSEQPQSGQSQSAQNPELVKQAQEKLSAAGHDAGPSDGVMGPKTQAALKEFQQAKGLESSGKLDQETLAALEINTPEGSMSSSTGSSSSAGASSPSTGSSSGASSSDSPSATGSQPPSQPGSEGKQQ
jgi:peptidoglycan hydrolase-like protein with peptidoglycan-binding domain